MKNPSLLFVGTFVPNEIEKDEKNISAAGNRFQNNLIYHLEQTAKPIQKLSYIAVPLSLHNASSLPNYCVLNNSKKISKALLFHKKLKAEIASADAVISYNVIYSWLFLPCIARRYKKKSMVVLADYSGPESYRSLPRKIYAKLMLWSIRKYDVVVGLSENIRTKIGDKQQFILMEGGIDEALFSEFELNNSLKDTTNSSITRYMYSGLLSEVTGVNMLLSAMRFNNNSQVELIITGKGPLEDIVQEASLKDSRIKYLGSLPYDEYINQLKNADVFINPRNMTLPENQNNFPSKIFDYLATGKPIISTKFSGWESFQDVIHFIDMEVSELTNAIVPIDVTNNSYYLRRDFSKKYLWDVQTKRLVELL